MSTVDELYLYLPSSVKSTVVENAISHYTTLLHAPVKLAAEYEYEVGLVKLIYPTTVYNIYAGNFSYYSYELKKIEHTRIQAGFYQNASDVMKAFAHILGVDQSYYVFSIDVQSRKFLVNCKPKTGSTVKPYLELSENLQVITGLPKVIFKQGFTVGTGSWDMTGGVQNMYIYISLAKNINIGQTLAPVLSVVNYDKSLSAQVEYEPKNVVYVPLNVSAYEIQNITVELRTKTGDYVPFTAGEALLVVHIRPRIPRL